MSKFFEKSVSVKVGATDQAKEVILFVNDEQKLCIATHDEPLVNIESIAYIVHLEMFCIYSSDKPDGGLYKNQVDERLVPYILGATSILYVNFKSGTKEIQQEQWVPLKIMD